jgi:shikimate kinase
MSTSNTSPQIGSKIFLIGFMGSGKTHWGRIWSQQYALGFFDLDEVIEQEQKRTIAEIFEKDGEAYFRDLETKALKTISKNNNCIIACGGGAPCFNNNLHWMNENGVSVYLSASAKYLYNRVIEEKDKRPVLKKISKSGLLLFIEKKLNEREPVYKQAHLILDAAELTAASFERIKNYKL